MADVLDVYLNQDLAGYLEENRGKLSYTYEKAWIESDRFIPLSVTLPPQVEAFHDEVARPFFENLLPEGEIRAAIARLKQLSEKNTFGLLGEIGGDCAGAISLWRHSQEPRRNEGYAELTDTRLAEILAAMAKRPLLVVDDELRLSLAGAQNKLPVYYDGKQLALPRGSAPSSHILKPGARGYDHMPANEAFCMHLARALGLPVPDSMVLRKQEALYLVERYDRIRMAGGAVSRIHQIDFCQALNLPSQKKYEHEGGPSLAACFEIITKYSVQPARDRLHLISWAIFNFIVGNADAHAKNLSLLVTREGIALAPFYDLVSTAAYKDLSTKLALKIGGENRPEWIHRKHWQSLAEVSAANPRIVWQRMDELAEAMPSAAEEMAAKLELRKDEMGTIDKLTAVIAARANHIRRKR